MQQTTKLNLNKPDLTDYVSIADLNENMDILDAAVGELKEGSAVLPDLETTNKTLAGGINEVKSGLTTHLVDDAMHIWEEIGSVTLSVDTPAIEFTDIPTKYRYLKLILKGYNSSTSVGTLQLWVNGDNSYVLAQLGSALNTKAALSPSRYEIMIDNELNNHYRTLTVEGSYLAASATNYTAWSPTIVDAYPTLTGHDQKITRLRLNSAAFNLGAKSTFILLGLK